MIKVDLKKEFKKINLMMVLFIKDKQLMENDKDLEC